MRSPRLLCLLALSALLSGCGSSPKGTDPNPGVPPNPSAVPLILDGNWEISAPIAPSTTFPAPLPSPVANFTGALHSSKGKVTGTFRALATPTGSQCVDIFTNLPVTGTLDSSGNLNLSIALPGGTATVTAALPSNLRSKTAATWQIVAGPCAMPTTAVHIEQFAPLTGAYTGTFSRLDLATRSPIPGTSVAVTGSCTGVIAITDGIVAGNGVESRSFSLPFPHPIPPIFNGAIDLTATTLIAAFDLLPACGNQAYAGILTRQ